MDARIAYMAGFFDGEGYVGCNKANNYSISVKVTQNTTKVLKLFKKYFDGNIIEDISPRTDSNRKPHICYNWEVYGKNAYLFLSQIHPYLVVKKEQVWEALKLEKLMHKGTYKISYANMAKRQSIYVRLKLLKRILYVKQ